MMLRDMGSKGDKVIGHMDWFIKDQRRWTKGWRRASRAWMARVTTDPNTYDGLPEPDRRNIRTAGIKGFRAAWRWIASVVRDAGIIGVRSLEHECVETFGRYRWFRCGFQGWFLQGIRTAVERGLIVSVDDMLVSPNLARHLCSPVERGDEAA